MLTKKIRYQGDSLTAVCDEKCNKAWGNNLRPEIILSDDLDDYAYLADTELGDAPIDPGTRVGKVAKPLEPYDRMNKWCIGECERCKLFEKGAEIELDDFNQRFYNYEPHYRDQDEIKL
jgi:hypothetical protein